MLNADELAVVAKAHRQGGRCDLTLHKAIRRLTESSTFNGFIIIVIFVNALFMALETEKTVSGSVAELIDYVFLAIYTLEFILKIYAEPKGYWKSYYNIFDFLILAISWVQVCITWARITGESRLGTLKVLRALRTLRTLRTVSFIRGLQVLVTALIDTIRKWVFNILILLMLLMFLFAIIGYYFFGYHEDNAEWGNLGRAMLSLFSFVTVDGWTDLQDRLDEMTVGSRIYTILFIFLGHFIFTNVFIGVIIINISEAAENYKRERRAEREAIVRHKKEFMLMRQHNDVKQMMERQKRGAYANFAEMVHEFEGGLRHEDFVLVSDLCTNLIWMETYINTLDHIDTTLFKCQQIHFEISNVLAETFERKLIQKMMTHSPKNKRRMAVQNNP